MLTGPLQTDEEVQRALQLIGQTNGRERALDDVNAYLAAVNRELETLPAGPASDALRQLSRYTVDRVG